MGVGVWTARESARKARAPEEYKGPPPTITGVLAGLVVLFLVAILASRFASCRNPLQVGFAFGGGGAATALVGSVIGHRHAKREPRPIPDGIEAALLTAFIPIGVGLAVLITVCM
jgi:hypothetical protein